MRRSRRLPRFEDRTRPSRHSRQGPLRISVCTARGAPARSRRSAPLWSANRWSDATTFLVLLSAPAWARIVSSGLLRGDGLLLFARRAAAPHELQRGHLFLLLAMDVLREVLHRVLGSLALIGRERHHLCFVLFFVVLVFI